jgi:hypothetical protein
MVTHKSQILFSLIVVSALSAGAVVLRDRLAYDDNASMRDEFQSLVYGLGFGSSVDLSQCAFSFDPRLESACSRMEGPIPGGFFLCPRHVACVTGYPHLLPFSGPISETSHHAAFR